MNLITLQENKCQTKSDKKRFGICDKPHPTKAPAYIDEQNGGEWIAVVENEQRYSVTFTAIDHCIDITKPDGAQESRCDGALHYLATVIFVELKARGAWGNEWVKDADRQLRATINNFEKSLSSDEYKYKKAYIANKEHPKFKDSQMNRMDKFLAETGYTLRVENRITL